MKTFSNHSKFVTSVTTELEKTGEYLSKNTCLVEFFGFSKKHLFAPPPKVRANPSKKHLFASKKHLFARVLYYPPKNTCLCLFQLCVTSDLELTKNELVTHIHRDLTSALWHLPRAARVEAVPQSWLVIF